MAPKPKLNPFKPLIGEIEYLTVKEISRRFDADGNAVRRAIRSLPEGVPLRSADIPIGKSGCDRYCNPALFEMVSMATVLPVSRWEELTRER